MYTSSLQFLSNVPGPGTYGEGGVPWAAQEKKAQLSQGTVGALEAGEQEIRTALTVGSDLAPGQYCHTAPLDQLLNKKTSTRGPYDLYSGERYQIPKSQVYNTHHSTMGQPIPIPQIQNQHLCPGRYNLRPFTADLNGQNTILQILIQCTISLHSVLPKPQHLSSAVLLQIIIIINTVSLAVLHSTQPSQLRGSTVAP